jgi:hypothetical protein
MIGALVILYVNVIALVAAVLRGIAYDRRERAFWRAYDLRRTSESLSAGAGMKGHCL